MRAHTPHGPRFEPLLRSLYRIALMALPRWFRCRWASDMRMMFRDRLHEAADSGGLPAAVAIGSRELGSIAFAAFQSRFEQATGRVHRAREAQDGSDVWRTDPVPALFPKQDRQGLKIAGIGALACHLALFMVVLPGTSTPPLPAVGDPLVFVPKWFPPPPPPEVKVTTKKVHRANLVPIPDPTPDAPDPIYDPRVEYVYEVREPVQAEFAIAPPAAPPPASALGRVRAGSEVEWPRLVVKVGPVYPQLALRARLECTVLLEAIVGKEGNIIGAEVVQACGLGLDAAAIAAVEQWRYTPTLLNGRPVEVIALVRVVFELH